MAIEHFTLPRTDWYDADGRIYKDILIENFNALEEKLLQLSAQDVIEVTIADYININLPKITDLSTAKDDQLVSLESFVDLLGLTYFPLNMLTDGSTVKQVSFYDDEYVLHTIEDTKPSDIDATHKYVCINTSSNTLVALETFSTSGYVLIGIYENGSIVSANNLHNYDINILQPLANMPYVSRDCGSGRKEAWMYAGRSMDRWCCFGRHEKYGYGSAVYCTCCDQGDPKLQDNYYGKLSSDVNYNRTGI